MRKLLAILCGLSVVFSSTYAVENVVVDSQNRNVINTGVINYASGQLRVANVDVLGGGGGGGGGGGSISAISLIMQSALCGTPVDFIVSSGTATGTVSLASVPANAVWANITGSSAVPTWAALADLKVAMGLDLVNNTSDAGKPVSTATQTALDLKESISAHNADITSIDTALASKAETTDVDTALALKAAITYVDTGLATKQNSWGVPATNGYIAAGNTDGSLFWVDPVTLGTTSQSFTDGVENSTTTFTSATANFVNGDVGKTITGDDIPGGTTIASVTNSTTVILSAAATATGSSKNFTILNRLEVGGTGTVTSVAAGKISARFISFRT